MKNNQSILIVLFMTVLAITGCGGGSSLTSTDTDGGPATADISVVAVDTSTKVAGLANENSNGNGNSDGTLETTDEASNIITITEARAALERIDLKLPDALDCETLDPELAEECDGTTEDSGETTEVAALEEESEDNIHIDGFFIVDLLTGESNPAVTDLTIPSGTYNEIALRLTPLDDDSDLVPPEDNLLGNSLVVGGTCDDGSSVRTFLLKMRINEFLRFRNEEGLEVTESADVNNLVVSLDVNDWFADIDICGCLDSGEAEELEDGSFVIDEDHDQGVCHFLDELKQNLKDSGDVDGTSEEPTETI